MMDAAAIETETASPWRIAVWSHSKLMRIASISRWSGRGRELGDRLLHGALRGPVDVDLVNDCDVDRRDCISQAVFADARGELFARLTVEQLGVTQSAKPMVRFENHRCGRHRTEEASAAYFVHSGDELCARCPGQLLVF